MELALSGLASGFDWLSLVDQLVELQRTPQTRLREEQSLLQERNSAYGNILAELEVLQSKIDALNEADLYQQRRATLSNFGVATATTEAGTPVGSYAFAFSQLATAAVQLGATNVGAALNSSNDVSALVLSDAAFASAVTAGTFTVNGNTVTIATTDTLQQVFDKISTATGGTVTGSYDSATDKITFSSGSAITLGSAADTSNFLTVAKLTQNGTGTVSSSTTLGSLKLGAALSSGNFSTAVSDGGSGAGEFKINGVSISFSAGTDTLTDVLDRITDSTAGVTAQYDAINDRITLTNKTTGNIGIALQDVTGNFLAAAKLTTAAGGTLQAGEDLEYTVNGGATLTSHSNTVTADSHGIAGLTVTALAGASTVTTTTDTATGFPMLVEFFGTSAGAATRMRTLPDHAYQTGYAVMFASTGTLPSMINADAVYYVRRVDADDISIHLTAADAASGANPINFGASPPYTGDAYIYQVDPLDQSTSTSTPASLTITVEPDSDEVKTALADFVEQYNKVQTLISGQTASSTDEDGNVTAGPLAGDREIADLAARLRSLAFGQVTDLTGAIDQLADLGYATNGNDDNIALTDEDKLDAALAGDLDDIQDLFTTATTGIAAALTSYLDSVAGDEGSLADHRELLTEQSADIDDQIESLERIVQANREELIKQFIAMEDAQAHINQQLQFLQQQLGTS